MGLHTFIGQYQSFLLIALRILLDAYKSPLLSSFDTGKSEASLDFQLFRLDCYE